MNRTAFQAAWAFSRMMPRTSGDQDMGVSCRVEAKNIDHDLTSPSECVFSWP